jgi:hypothetical protein
VHIKTLRLVQKKQQTCASFAEGVKYYSTRDPKREEGLNKSQVNGGQKHKVITFHEPNVVSRKSMKSNPLIHLKGSEPLTPKGVN